jgi:phytoene dehydrogenase-like protein
MQKVSIVGGGLAGLVAGISCVEAGMPVELFEASASLGGRARTQSGEFRANLGPHVVYSDGFSWEWLRAHDLRPPSKRSPLYGLRFFSRGRVRRLPPRALARTRRLRGKPAPADQSFRAWVRTHCGEEVAEMLSRAAGVFTFDHDPGRLSAAFVAERGGRVLSPPPSNRYVIGGWQTMVDILAERARDLGVVINNDARVSELPDPPVIVATNLADAQQLLPAVRLSVTTTRCAILDLGLAHRIGDPFLVSDLDTGGWLERFSTADKSLAPSGHELVQGHIGLAPGEGVSEGVAKLERIADRAFPKWRERAAWRRQQLMDAKTGALDLPGTSWRDRPAVDQGDGLYLAGDWVGAPGLLSEVAFASAAQAAELAVERATATPIARSKRAARNAQTAPVALSRREGSGVISARSSSD